MAHRSPNARALRRIARAIEAFESRAAATLRSQHAREVPGYCALWRRVRITCEQCGAPLVYRRLRRVGVYSYAGCAALLETRCDYRIDGDAYLRAKHDVICDLLNGREPEIGYRLVHVVTKKKTR